MSYITLHPLCYATSLYFRRHSLLSGFQHDMHPHNDQQGVALCLSACILLVTHAHTVTHARTEKAPVSDRRQSLFVSD